ncbi:MAG: hypothetical protein ACYC9Y_02030 [Candidatus Methylomirabilia bacterium]
MLIDVRTLVFCNALVTACLAAGLLIYRASQKTYPGFTVWTVGTCFLAAGYLTLVLRGVTPLWLNILLANASFSLGALLRLDGIRMFLGRARLRRIIYGAPILLLVCMGYFFFVRESLSVRTMGISMFLAAVCFAIAWTLLQADTRGRKFHRIFGGLHLLWGLLLLTRALLLLTKPQYGLFDPVAVQIFFFVAITLFEVGIGFCFILLNAQRLEEELSHSRDNLQTALGDLQRSVSEVKVLRGLLPICASCKKIRDDQGQWRQIEVFIRDRSEAKFSHGICEDCAAKLYPSVGKP